MELNLPAKKTLRLIQIIEINKIPISKLKCNKMDLSSTTPNAEYRAIAPYSGATPVIPTFPGA